jgi:glucosylglycerate phosphorylase
MMSAGPQPQTATRLHSSWTHRIRAHLDALYPPAVAAATHDRFVALLERFTAEHPQPKASPVPFDETDVVLITYADQIRQPDVPAVQALREFLVGHVAGAITGVHLLPFYPWTSDDGFAVADYLAVDPEVGTWDDISAMGRDFRLMVDAVVNHVSASSEWFRRWRAGDPDFEDFFIVLDPGTYLADVTRPRASALLTPFETVDGTRHVWTTFSADQVDLNYANPEVLLAVSDVLLTYVAKGASVIRLDAVAFLWKEVGSPCVHLPRTHEVIRLWRTMLDAVAPGALLITETNVPHAENVAYFGNGDDEAHLVYQFPLAPLVLSAFHLADATTLREWASGLDTPSEETTFFNFLGSHDGVGVRPAEGLLTPAEINQLCELAKAHGGGVSYRAQPDGSLSPYELNTVFFDALTPIDSAEPRSVQLDRFLAAQSILLAFEGIPGVYVQALLGSRNWHEGVKETGRLRSINRRKLDLDELEAELADPSSLRQAVLTRFTERIRARVSEPAFHPNGAQRILDGNPAVFAFERVAPTGDRRVLCLHSLSGRPQQFVVPGETGAFTDLCSGEGVRASDGQLDVTLPPYGVQWLRED